MATQHERDGGFAIATYDEHHIDSNADERFGIKYGDAQERKHFKALGLLDAAGKIAPSGWAQLNKDVLTLERNAMAWLRKSFTSARDEGHSDSDLVGTF